MTADGADRAHEEKVAETADGERLVAHSTYTDGDRELREIQDRAEAERFNAQKVGYVAAPGVGDYHATRREAKLANSAFVIASGEGVEEDPSAQVVDVVREKVGDATKEAAQARKAADRGRSEGPANRQTRHEAMQGGTAGGTAKGPDGDGEPKSDSEPKAPVRTSKPGSRG